MKISQYAKESLEKMYRELTDDEVIMENKRKADRQKMIDDKKKDTGYE